LTAVSDTAAIDEAVVHLQDEQNDDHAGGDNDDNDDTY